MQPSMVGNVVSASGSGTESSSTSAGFGGVGLGKRPTRAGRRLERPTQIDVSSDEDFLVRPNSGSVSTTRRPLHVRLCQPCLRSCRRPISPMCRRLCWTIWNGICLRCSPPKLTPCLFLFPRNLSSQEQVWRSQRGCNPSSQSTFGVGTHNKIGDGRRRWFGTLNKKDRT